MRVRNTVGDGMQDHAELLLSRVISSYEMLSRLGS